MESVQIARAPPSMMTMAITHANTGRRMKKWAMAVLPYLLRASTEGFVLMLISRGRRQAELAAA